MPECQTTPRPRPSISSMANNTPSKNDHRHRKTRRKRRRKLFALAALTLGLVLALLASECLLRVYVASRGWTPNCYATGLSFFVPHPTAGHTLRPNLKLKSSTYNVVTDSRGLRGRDVALDNNHERIIVLGGSSVFGYLVGEGKDSCRLLENRLQKQGIQAQVFNAGVPGFNMTQCRLRFEENLAEMSPSHVIVYLGWNDSPFLISANPNELPRCPPAPPAWERILSNSVLYGFLSFRLFPADKPQFTPPNSEETQVTELGGELFRTELRKLIAAIQRSGAVPIVCTQVMAASNEDNNELDEFLGSTPNQIEANRRIGNWITTTIREEASELILVDCARDVAANSRTLGDAIHLTEFGHEQVARAWFNTLAPIMIEAE